MRMQPLVAFLPLLSSMAACSAEQQPHACFWLKSTSGRSAGQMSQKGILRASLSPQKNSSFKNGHRNKTCKMSTFLNFNYYESWTAVLTSVIVISLMLCWRLVHMRRSGWVTTTAITITTKPIYFICAVWKKSNANVFDKPRYLTS